MNCWDILGIEPTDDLKLIKRAYAQALKNIDRSKDIEGFQRLNGAYQVALKQAEPAADKPSIILAPAVPESSQAAPQQQLTALLTTFFHAIDSASNATEVAKHYFELKASPDVLRSLIQAEYDQVLLTRLAKAASEAPHLLDREFVDQLVADLSRADDVLDRSPVNFLLRELAQMVTQQEQRQLWHGYVDEEIYELFTDKPAPELNLWQKLKLRARVKAALTMPGLSGSGIEPHRVGEWLAFLARWPNPWAVLLQGLPAMFVLPIVLDVFLGVPVLKIMGNAALPFTYFLYVTAVVLLYAVGFLGQTDEKAKLNPLQKGLKYLRRPQCTRSISIGALVLAVALSYWNPPFATFMACLGLVLVMGVLARPVLLVCGWFIGCPVLIATHTEPAQLNHMVATLLGTSLYFVSVWIYLWIKSKWTSRQGARVAPANGNRFKVSFKYILVAIAVLRLVEWLVHYKG